MFLACASMTFQKRDQTYTCETGDCHPPPSPQYICVVLKAFVLEGGRGRWVIIIKWAEGRKCSSLWVNGFVSAHPPIARFAPKHDFGYRANERGGIFFSFATICSEDDDERVFRFFSLKNTFSCWKPVKLSRIRGTWKTDYLYNTDISIGFRVKENV